MTHGSLFSGIGGFDLAAEWMGWTNLFHCEWNPFGQRVLKYYWPNAESFHDITKTDFTKYADRIDILTGGFPCQPYSTAGKRLGKEDERHLWPEMLRAIREIRPRWVVGENVLGLVNWSRGLVFHEVQVDLEAAGYEVQPYVLPAAAINAPHRRDRVWFVAHRKRFGFHQCEQQRQSRCDARILERLCHSGVITNTNSKRLQSKRKPAWLGWERFGFSHSQNHKSAWENFPTQSPICSRNDGLPAISHGETFSEEHRMDRTELIIKCLSEGRIEVNPDTGKIYSRMIRGYEGQLIELNGSDCNGYVVHSIKYHGIKKQVKAHQIVWLSVNGVYDKNELQIDHINRDKKDNRIQNLRLVTAKENNANQNKWQGNFTEEQKDLMFMMHHEGHMSFREIAEDFGCSKSRIHQIVSEHKFNQLDGITFSKWRNESIKAYGNAIVPQVVYQIFKAIQQHEDLTHEPPHHRPR